jgi:uncharacterized phage protein (TIGR01671 family)
MREILFKAKIRVKPNSVYYNAEEKEFLESKLHSVDRMHLFDDGSVAIVAVTGDKTAILAPASFCDIELLQYTGVKDENGQKIFEGDILQEQELEDDERECYAIKFDSGVFYMTNDNIQYEIEYAEQFVKIGNIHENPELLEGN